MSYIFYYIGQREKDFFLNIRYIETQNNKGEVKTIILM